MPKKARLDATPSGGSSCPVLHDVVAWLERRRLEVPPALRAACPAERPAAGPSARSGKPPAETAEFQWAIGLLAALKERERRALARFVQQQADKASAPPAAPQAASDDEEGGGGGGPPSVRGGSWPADVRYSNDYVWGDDITPALTAAYRPSAPRRRAPAPCARTFVAIIPKDAAQHPAAGQGGLFAARPLAYGERVIDYVGAVCLGEHEDRSSDYVCDFGERSELALDAKSVGNEARYVNDYRNTGRKPNVEFRTRRDGRNELRQGIYVVDKAGVAEGDELLISYGQSYWRSRVEGSLEDFIYRKPGDAPRGAAAS